MLKTGKKAPEFELETVDGERKRLSEMLAAGPVVLGFFKSSCPVCQFTFPFLERLHQASDGADLQFVGVSQDTATSTEHFLSDYGVTFPTLLDNSSNRYEVSNAFGIRNVPSIFVINTDGTVGETMEGFEKAGLEELGEKAGAATFKPGEDVPAFRPG